MSATDPRSPAPSIDELLIADEPERWAGLGFEVAGESCELGGVRVRLLGRGSGGEGRGIVRWSLRGVAGVELDGLPTVRSESPVREPGPAHPNGVLGVDHVVAFSPDLDRSVRTLRAAGLDLRRIREEPTPAGAPRQAFFRLGAEILEVVQEPGGSFDFETDRARPARFWGLALNVRDLDETVAGLGERVGSIRPAVQRGRRIATLRRSAGLAVPVALMSLRADGASGPC
ncbi:MAG TPA: hypothetical protein VGX16_06220 [Solirubrobacteraceae bacterium]|jgi:catechol 2,3-dioxygenase-like lactoylglutathione lyase family enzyme|nr:hypothetical protein [Solirubrobacteraceae bacterium]